MITAEQIKTTQCIRRRPTIEPEIFIYQTAMIKMKISPELSTFLEKTKSFTVSVLTSKFEIHTLMAWTFVDRRNVASSPLFR